jgi:porin
LVYSQHLKSSPFSFKLGYIIDYVDILSGEGKSGRGFLGNIDLKMNFETSKASLWKNGNFFIYVLGNHGIKPTKDNLGGIQTFDNIETEDKIQLFQFYYRHKINNFSLTIGQSNIDEYFFHSDYGSNLLNSNFNTQPDIACNIPVSIFSKATLGITMNWEFSRKTSLSTCIYKLAGISKRFTVKLQ